MALLRRKRFWVAVLVVSGGLGLLEGGVRADTLYIGQADRTPIPYAKVQVLRIEGGQIVFRSREGNDTRRELSQVQRMELDDEPALNAGETAYAAGDFDKATDEYLRAQRATSKAWLKQWIAVRLLTSANKSGRFDAAASAYADLVLTDVRLAQDNRPQFPDNATPKPGVLESAIAELDKALGKTGLTAEQKQALLQFQLEVARARGDSAKTGKVLEQLLAAGGGSGAAAAGGGDQRALMDVRLSQAQVAADGKDFAKAVSIIEQNKAGLTEPRQQAEALFLLARAKDAEAHAGGGKADPVKLKDAALAYMRVVAHFKDIESARARVPASMLRAAQLLEEAGAPDDAKVLYKELAEGNEASVKEPARAGLERVGGRGQGTGDRGQ